MNYIQLKNGYSSLEVSDDRPKLQLSDMETQNTLKRNNHLIQSTKSFLIHVLDNILVEDKFIILSDETGAIINIISDTPIMQRFFECGFKLGTKMTIDSIGENALARSLISKNINISNTLLALFLPSSFSIIRYIFFLRVLSIFF